MKIQALQRSPRPAGVAATLLVLSGAFAPVTGQINEFLGPHITETLAIDAAIPGTGRIGGMTRDSYGYLYVANQDEGVWKIHPSGEVELFVTGLYGSGGNTVMRNGHLLQADYNGNRVIRVDRAGNIFPFLDDGLNGPVGIAATRSGDVFIANYRGNYITKVSAAGETSEFARDERLDGPNGITLDPDGNIYVVNLGNTLVLKITPAGEMTEIATLPGTANAHVTWMNGSLYVTQIWSHVVLKVEMDGRYEVVAGNGTIGFDDGPGNTAEVAYPNGIVASSLGDAVYFNTLKGRMLTGHVGVIEIRKLNVPSPLRTFLTAYEAGGVSELRATFDRAMGLREASPAQIAPALYNVSRRLLDLGHGEAGLPLVSWIAAVDPDKARGHLQVGNVHAVWGDRDEAISQYEQLLSLQPDNDEVKLRLDAVRAYRP